jgi:hypothetical protein
VMDVRACGEGAYTPTRSRRGQTFRLVDNAYASSFFENANCVSTCDNRAASPFEDASPITNLSASHSETTRSQLARVRRAQHRTR